VQRRALAGLAGDAELAVNSEGTSLTPAPMSFDGRIGPDR
jgi:hypothetical protein